jgi:glycosyltransferase involved in cell wall biosynthesis
LVAAEFALQAGKVQNLRVAARYLDGLVIPAGQVFSFWRQVPRPTRGYGFVQGRELREGCVIPSVGGGLCQLSNALYDAALTAGFEIVERHAHSRKLSGSMAAAGRDATVFWNYVDLRFRPQAAVQLSVKLTKEELIVRFLGVGNGEDGPGALEGPTPTVTAEAGAVDSRLAAESCETCGVRDCFRHLPVGALAQQGCTAWLVDVWSPELDAYLAEHRQAADWLLTPLDSRRWRVGPYRWDSTGFAQVKEAWGEVVRRSIVSRRLVAQGAARQRALLQMDESLARHFARRTPAAATHLVVSQNLLPFLWREGVLGGRTFDVLMNRLPMAALQETLDRAAQRHPGSRTLADFRADPELVAAESEALRKAHFWITPHRAVAKLAGCQARLLDWRMPCGVNGWTMNAIDRGEARIVFPASTLDRKGALELREAMRALRSEVTLVLAGRSSGSPAFWEGVRTVPAGEDWLAGATVVVLPAWVEHQPRRLLAALARGVPVICTPACGLGEMPGVTEVPEGDGAALIVALRASMKGLVDLQPVST